MRPAIWTLAIAVAIIAIFAFLRPAITGMPILDTTLTVVTTVNNSCNLTLEEGWNLVSFPCITNDVSLQPFLSSYLQSINSIWYYDPASASDHWKSYNPSLPVWVVQDLSTLSRRYAYWIDAKSRVDIYIEGELFTPTAYSLSQGWNLVGYPSTASARANDTFHTLAPDYDYVMSYNASDSDGWKMYTWNSSLPSDQDLVYTVPYGGYWIYLLGPKGYVVS